MVEFDVRDINYDEYTDRQLAAVPLAVLAIALLILIWWWVTTGSPVTLGIDFTGGTEMRVQTGLSHSEIRATFGESLTSIQGVVGSNDVYVLQFQSANVQSLRQQAQTAGMSVLSSAATPPSFGAGTQRTAIIGLVVAFVGMSIVVFALFRMLVPCLAVIAAATSNMLIPLAVMNLLGIKLSLGTVAALLLIIGYSVDSDILLTSQVLRRSGDFYESVYRAMETGVTMTLTSMAAMAVMAITASLFRIDLMASIGTILVIGLLADLMNTYLLNVSLLRWYKFKGIAR